MRNLNKIISSGVSLALVSSLLIGTSVFAKGEKYTLDSIKLDAPIELNTDNPVWEKAPSLERGAKKNDSEYDIVNEIIQLDCADCHSKDSTMSKAIPSMPFETYEEIKLHVEPGYSWKKMSKQAHIHMFGISMFLVVLTLIFAYSTYSSKIKNILIIASFSAAFLDIFSWWFSKFFSGLVYLIFIMGGVMVSSILLMSVLILINLWDIKKSEIKL